MSPDFFVTYLPDRSQLHSPSRLEIGKPWLPFFPEEGWNLVLARRIFVQALLPLPKIVNVRLREFAEKNVVVFTVSVVIHLGLLWRREVFCSGSVLENLVGDVDRSVEGSFACVNIVMRLVG
ncbi:MAG: hypothetical protein ACR2M4_08770 [Actinomycetota bacterium]